MTSVFIPKPAGFANFSFGHADDGSKYFGFGWYADFDVVSGIVKLYSRTLSEPP